MTALVLRYCDRLDWASGTPVGWLSGADALVRDCAGEPYAVLVAVRGRLLMAVDVAWRRDHLAVWVFDEEGRPARCTEYRRYGPARMFPVRTVVRRYSAGEVREETVRRDPGGAVRVAGGRAGVAVGLGRGAADALWRPVPRMNWAALIAELSGEPVPAIAVLEPIGDPIPAAARPGSRGGRPRPGASEPNRGPAGGHPSHPRGEGRAA